MFLLTAAIMILLFCLCCARSSPINSRKKTIAVMQPYFCPYVVYYSLIHQADEFYLFDDVNFITRGWINRNRLLVNGQEFLMTVPLSNSSQNRLIQEIKIHNPQQWGANIAKTLKHAYGKSPFFKEVEDLLAPVLSYSDEDLVELCARSHQAILQGLGLDCKIRKTSSLHYDRSLKGEEKILAICKAVEATDYINLPGGRALYNQDKFKVRGLELHFIEGALPELEAPQRKNFKPEYSIIDTLFTLGKEQTAALIRSFGVP